MDQKNPDVATLREAAVADFDAAAGVRLRERPERFINRELSWLHFNRRVLEEASNPNHPVLERLRFLSISANNLDEFFMVRVAGLKGQQRQGIAMVSDDGQSLERAARRASARRSRRWPATSRRCWGALRARARRQRHRARRRAARSPTSERDWLEHHFLDSIFPVLTPLADRPGASVPVHPQSRLHRRAAAGAQANGQRDDRAPAHAGDARPLHPPAGERARRRPLHQPRPGGDAVHRRGSSPATRSKGRAPSASSATSTSRSRKRPRISSASSRAR